MDREQAKELLPIIQAFAEDRSIEFKDSYGNWVVGETPSCRILVKKL